MDLRKTARERDLGWLAIFLGAAFGAAGVGGALTAGSVGTWYRTIRRPAWNPPDWLFGPVWTLLYLMMGVSAWLVRRGMRESPARLGTGPAELSTDPAKLDAGRAALVAWTAQLALNVGWSAVFFGRRDIAGGLGTIAVLWAAIATTVGLTGRVSRRAALLLLPYLAWTSFAALLNYRIWQLNQPR